MRLLPRGFYRLEIMPHRYEREHWFWTERGATRAYRFACKTVDRSGPWSVSLFNGNDSEPYRQAFGAP